MSIRDDFYTAAATFAAEIVAHVEMVTDNHVTISKAEAVKIGFQRIINALNHEWPEMGDDSPPPNPLNIEKAYWKSLSDQGIVVPDYDARCWYWNGDYYCSFFGIDQYGYLNFG